MKITYNFCYYMKKRNKFYLYYYFMYYVTPEGAFLENAGVKFHKN